MAFPNAPTPLSYGPPNVQFEGLDQLGDRYFKGAEDRRKYDLARAFQGGIPKDANGNPDFRAMAEVLAQHGSPESVIPLNREAVAEQERTALQGTPVVGGPSPQIAPPQQSFIPPPSPTPSARGTPQPALSSAGTDNTGAQTMRALATELAGGKEVGSIIKNVAMGLKVDPDAPLTPEQETQLKPILAKSIASLQQQSQQQQAPANSAQGPSLLPPGTDPRQEIAKLRATGENLLRVAGDRGKGLAQQYFDRADRIESDTFGEIRRSQSNIDRAFEEQKRQHGAAEMTPVKIGVGAFGEEIYAVKDPASGGFRTIDPKTGKLGSVVDGNTGTVAPVKESVIPAKELELDRKAGRNVEYLQNLDPEQQGIVRKMANYEMNPTSLSIKGGHRERVLAAVAQFDPNYDQKNYLAFSDGLKKFQSGKEGSSVRSFNVGIEHIDQLLELGRALNNGDIPKINELKNWVKRNVGQDAPTNFDGLKAIVGAEIVKAIVGAGGTGEERAAAARTVSGASSLAQLEGIAKTYASAMGAQLSGLQRQYEQSTGRKDFDRLLSSQAIRYRDSHNAPSSGAEPLKTAPAGKSQTVIQNGHTYTLQPDGSYK